MDGIHDLGGLEGLGPIDHTSQEPPFHEPWEGRTHGMMLSLGIGGHMPPWFRFAIEQMDPREYLSTSYYEHWLHAVEGLLLESGTIERDELDNWAARVAAGEMVPTRLAPDHAAIVPMLFTPSLSPDAAHTTPAFAVGDAVVVRRQSPRLHSRCPRYVRGARGRIVAIRTEEVFAERAMTGDDRRESTYGVAFESDDLWGARAEPCTVIVDLWESHLEAT